MEELESKPRLEANDKRFLFNSLLARCDRMLYRNPFPLADTLDFALSLMPPNEEDAWRLLYAADPARLDYSGNIVFTVPAGCFDGQHKPYKIHLQKEGPDHGKSLGGWSDDRHSGAFPTFGKSLALWAGMRNYMAMIHWAERQWRLERRLLVAAETLKALVLNCNTVGQWKRLSPELLPFLPEKYQLHLRHYQKRSPYPNIGLPPDYIKKLVTLLAMAGFLPKHPDEELYHRRAVHSRLQQRYDLSWQWFGAEFTGARVRQLDITNDP